MNWRLNVARAANTLRHARNAPDRCSLIILCIIIYLSCYCPYWLYWSRFWTSSVSLHHWQLNGSDCALTTHTTRGREKERENIYQLSSVRAYKPGRNCAALTSCSNSERNSMTLSKAWLDLYFTIFNTSLVNINDKTVIICSSNSRFDFIKLRKMRYVYNFLSQYVIRLIFPAIFMSTFSSLAIDKFASFIPLLLQIVALESLVYTASCYYLLSIYELTQLAWSDSGPYSCAFSRARAREIERACEVTSARARDRKPSGKLKAIESVTSFTALRDFLSYCRALRNARRTSYCTDAGIKLVEIMQQQPWNKAARWSRLKGRGWRNNIRPIFDLELV